MEINQRVVVMREAITKIVPMLSKKAVKVTMRGMKAFVEYHPTTLVPMRVNLPYLPDDCSEELMNAVQGFLDHEVGHILFTDAKAVSEAAAKGDEVASLHNAIEDTFVEAGMRDQFTGSAYNLANVSRFFLNKMVSPRLEIARQEGNQDAVMANLVVPAIRAWAGQGEFEAFMQDKQDDILPLTQLVGDDLIAEIPRVTTSAECLDLAVRINERLSKGGVKPPPPPKGDGEGGSGDGSGKKSDKGKAGGKSEDEEGKSGADGKGESGDGEGEGEGEGEAPGSEGEEGDEGDDESGTRGNLTPEMNSELVESAKAAIRNAADFDESVAEILSERAAQEARNSDYIVFTRDDDLMEPLPYSKRAIDLIPEMQKAVDSMLGPLQKDIERMIAARSAQVWTGGYKSGRLHSSALMRTQFNRVDLFKRKQTNTTKDVAVQLIMDCSGSMTSDNKIQTAAYAAYALSAILDRLNIANEVVGYTTKNHSAQVLEDLRNDPLMRSYARLEALNMPIFKDFDERMSTEVKARLIEATISHQLCHSNVDGESILLLSQRLRRRRETRKVMMVLNDGRPAVMGGGDLDGHLTAVIKLIEQSGINVVGLGIMDRSVSKFYPRHVVMKSVNDLPGLVMGELKKLLMQ